MLTTGAQVIIEKPLTEPVNNIATNSGKPAPKVILWPNTGAPAGNQVAYLVRPQPATPINVIRPSYVAGPTGSTNNTSLITNVLKPVMTTGIYDHQPKKVEMPRQVPVILPKPPVVSVAPTRTAPTLPKTSTPPSFIVTTSVPSKITTVSDPNLFGTTKYPIQLVQAGNTFRTLQPLNNNQVTQIAKVLKNKQGFKDPEIVYEDTKNRRKLVYKIVCKEDLPATSTNPNVLSSSSESSDDEDDSEEIRTKNLTANEVVLNPHDVLKMTDPNILR